MFDPALIVASLFVITVAGAVVIYYRYRMNQQLNQQLAAKNAEIRAMNEQLESLNRELSGSERRYRQIFRQSPVGIFYYNTDLVITDFNERFVAILQSSDDKLRGLSMLTLRDQRVVDSLRDAIDGHTGQYEGEYNATTSAAKLYIRLVTAPLWVDEHTIMGGVGIVENITERRKAEQQLISAKNMAEQADKLKDTFMANMSHEIRTPLNVIMGYIGIVQTEYVARHGGSEDSPYFRKINLAAKRLLRTVDQILNLSWLEAGSYALNPSALNLPEFVRELVAEMEPLAVEKEVEFSYMPECGEPLVWADRYSVGQTVLNLLDNAIKFTDSGSIDVRVFNRGNNVCLSIRDTGVGIASKYLSNIYNPFSQEESGYSRAYDGLGLGLALAKRYMDMNGGRIEVDSEKGKGTMVYLEFPRHASPEPARPIESGKGQVRRRLEGETPVLLIVEDDVESQQYMNLILSKDYQLHFAATAADAWQILHSDIRIHLVIMDISLRGPEDGLSLTKRIRKSSSMTDIPVIAVTAHAYENDRKKSMLAGCDAYMSKPFKLRELKEYVQEFVG